MKRLNWKPIAGGTALAALLIFGTSFAADGDKLAQNSTPPPAAPAATKPGENQSILTTAINPIVVVKVVPTPPPAAAKGKMTATALPGQEVTYTFSLDSTVNPGGNAVHATADFREIYSLTRGTGVATLTTGGNARQAVFSGGAPTASFDITYATPYSLVVTLPSDSAGKQYFLAVTGTADGATKTYAGGDIIGVLTPPEN